MLTRALAFAPVGLLIVSTVSAQPADAVFGGGKLSQFFRAAQSTRVDVVGIGDSNQLHLGGGWDHAWIISLDTRFGTYASSLLSMGESQGNSANAGVGFRIFSTSSQGFFRYDGAGPFYDDFLSAESEIRPLNYVAIPEGEEATLGTHGLFLPPDGVIPTTEPLRFEITYASFESHVDPVFQPVLRLGQAPFSVLAESDPVRLDDGVAIHSMSFEFGGGASSVPLQVMLGNFNTTISGPFVAYTIRAIRSQSTSGASFSTLYYLGNQSARDMAAALLESSDTYISRYFSTIRSCQGDNKFVLVRINTGVNDRNEHLPPPDGSGFPPSSADAYSTNLASIMDRISSVWVQSGWDERELHFLITPTHPIDDPDDEQLAAYRQAARELSKSRPRVAVVDMSVLTNEQELLENSWYRFGGLDRNHLNLPGYETLALRELDALLSYTECPDITGDGLINLADLNAVLAAFGQESPASDLTGDGFVDLVDLNALLQAFGSSCSASS